LTPRVRTRPFGAVVGVLGSVLQMIEDGATHLGIATDHVIESFRNELWRGYKTAEGVDPALVAQFQPLEAALAAMGIAVWPMIKLEADDALASAAFASADTPVKKVCIWTPDKDLGQSGSVCARIALCRVDRRSKTIRDAEGVRSKLGVSPALIPDYLALVATAWMAIPAWPASGKRR
jgi:5'-3' exonuclease